ncbi:uncharacterized protein TOT_040000932 [Theileria orientalis strain Shintoku]|uniref:ER membrane protein complex subunit 6 n=1 Tax=Theileria orientalis strain Shintoku TaxID=869250 RepID=J4C4A9_THEOR|nr:uncharacterized protein TOT_040000932 [Theileria orientalis strain Shintoku]BAM41866.1 uncharacterized protein TOT_040000932 [Theileria orientalis strain Shintoku]|eukprot:XP_009692167.1 uncharacterized protein TOT_040000932 [Theileria orientalis strain Shintoku]
MANPSQFLKIDQFFKKDHPKRNLSIRIFYIKSSFALILGLLLGIFKVNGAVGFMVFLSVQYMIGRIYCSQFNVPDYMLDNLEVFTEHILPSFGLFLVFWTVTYTLSYPNQ